MSQKAGASVTKRVPADALCSVEAGAADQGCARGDYVGVAGRGARSSGRIPRVDAAGLVGAAALPDVAESAAGTCFR